MMHSYLVHGEASVVEVAAASIEANFSHAVVNQEEIPELWKKPRSPTHNQTAYFF